MRRLTLGLLLGAFMLTQASAKRTNEGTTLVESKTFDNFYVGMGGGLSVMPFYTQLHRHLNPMASVRVGRNFTPVFGVALEGSAYFDDKPWNTIGNIVKYTNAGAMATINFSNWIGGYRLQPWLVEVEGVAGLGWGHSFGTRGQKHSQLNDVTSKTGVNVGFNLGKKRAWKVYLEPAFTWNILDGGARDEGVQFNYKKSFVQASVGVCYRFKNSNGTHHFKRIGMNATAEADTQAQVKELFAELDSVIHVLGDVEYDLNQKNKLLESMQQVQDSTNQATQAEAQRLAAADAHSMLPVMVVFKEGSSEIGAAQMPAVELVAQYLKEHPEVVIEVRGYATPDADLIGFQRMAEARAGSVKYALVKQFGVDADRVSAVGGGNTTDMFEHTEFNRIVTFRIIKDKQ